MLIKRRFLDGIVDGSVDLQFRRWRRPMVKVGGTMRTAVGVLEVVAVDVVTDDQITTRAARRAGHDSVADLLAQDKNREGDLYRIRLRFVGDDPRIALREDANLDAAALADIEARLERLDRVSPRGPWTLQVLQLVADRPATLAATLAESIGRDRDSFKLDVRKLKNLGLTESLPVGYRISPRGAAVLRSLTW